MTTRQCLDGEGKHDLYNDGEVSPGETIVRCARCPIVAYETDNHLSLQTRAERVALHNRVFRSFARS